MLICRVCNFPVCLLLFVSAAHSINAAQAALAAVSSNLPGGNSPRGSAPPPPPANYDDPGTQASVQAAKHPEALQCSAQQQAALQQHSLSPAGPSASRSSDSTSGASDSAVSTAVSGGNSGGGGGAGPEQRLMPGQSSSVMSSANCSLASLQVVTELSVNIDAEEGAEILREMSELSLLESLMVDSTDEFTIDPGMHLPGSSL